MEQHSTRDAKELGAPWVLPIPFGNRQFRFGYCQAEIKTQILSRCQNFCCQIVPVMPVSTIV
jgi:hypothetical protein